jgi:hypothetical protein
VDIPEAASVEQNKVAMRAIGKTTTVDHDSLIGRQFDDHFCERPHFVLSIPNG